MDMPLVYPTHPQSHLKIRHRASPRWVILSTAKDPFGKSQPQQEEVPHPYRAFAGWWETTRPSNLRDTRPRPSGGPAEGVRPHGRCYCVRSASVGLIREARNAGTAHRRVRPALRLADNRRRHQGAALPGQGRPPRPALMNPRPQRRDRNGRNVHDVSAETSCAEFHKPSPRKRGPIRICRRPGEQPTVVRRSGHLGRVAWPYSASSAAAGQEEARADSPAWATSMSWL